VLLGTLNRTKHRETGILSLQTQALAAGYHSNPDVLSLRLAPQHLKLNKA
jgi:hypothetical protein